MNEVTMSMLLVVLSILMAEWPDSMLDAKKFYYYECLGNKLYMKLY